MGKAENYKKDKPIGEGSYGKVFQGWKLDTQQVVALKFISKVRDPTSPKTPSRNKNLEDATRTLFLDYSGI